MSRMRKVPRSCAFGQLARRRRMSPRPARARLMRARVPGSGTLVALPFMEKSEIQPEVELGWMLASKLVPPSGVA